MENNRLKHGEQGAGVAGFRQTIEDIDCGHRAAAPRRLKPCYHGPQRQGSASDSLMRCGTRMGILAVAVGLLAGCTSGEQLTREGAETGGNPLESAMWSSSVERLPPVSSPTGTSQMGTSPMGMLTSLPSENTLKPVDDLRLESPFQPTILQFNGSSERGNPYLSAEALANRWERSNPVVRLSYQEPVEAGEVDDVDDDDDGQVEESNQLRLATSAASQASLPAAELLPTPDADESPPVTLHFDDINVRQALELLSRQQSMNLLIAPGVTGRVTADLHDLSFHEALRAILKLCNLVAHVEGNILFVYALGEVPRLDRELRAFPLDFVSPADVMQGVQGLLSPAGQAFATESSATDNRKTRDMIVVEDLPDYVRRIEQYISQVDQAPRQVLIEVNILEVELSDENKHGVNFNHMIHFMGNNINLEMHGFANPLAPQAFFVNVDGRNLEALVEMLKKTTNAKTLASPRLLVLNGQEARIQVGEQLGYKVITATETASMEDVRFMELGVVLTVTPRISRDNRVVLHVNPQVSSGRIDTETLLPEEETTEVETDVILSDGQGMVIGGLIREKDIDVQSKVPLLGDLWMIGRLFQKREIVKSRTEIIITLIPRVLPYLPQDAMRDQVETARAAAPLVHGPLCRYPRPWEPSLRDAVHDPLRLHDLRIHDSRCQCEACRFGERP